MSLRSVLMDGLVFALIFIGAPVGQVSARDLKDQAIGDPLPFPPVKPKAKLLGPTAARVGSNVLLNFQGTVSQGDPDFDIAKKPEGSGAEIFPLYNKQHQLVFGAFVPDKPGLYRFALIAKAPNPADPENSFRAYAFWEVNVTGTNPPGPIPDPDPDNPPKPPVDPPVDPPADSPVKDTYGFYKFARQLMAKMPANGAWRAEAPKVATVFDIMTAQKSAFTDPTKFVETTSAAYKAVLGPSYSANWSAPFFEPLKAALREANTKGVLPTTIDAHVEVWRELSAALKGVK